MRPAPRLRSSHCRLCGQLDDDTPTDYLAAVAARDAFLAEIRDRTGFRANYFARDPDVLIPEPLPLPHNQWMCQDYLLHSFLQQPDRPWQDPYSRASLTDFAASPAGFHFFTQALELLGVRFLEAQDAAGSTVLHHLAGSYPASRHVQHLRRHGYASMRVPNVDVENRAEGSAFHCAVMDGKTDKLDLVVLLAQMGANVSDEDNRAWMIQKEHDEAGTYLDVMFKHAVPEHRVSVHRVNEVEMWTAFNDGCWNFLHRFLLESYANLIETDEDLTMDNLHTHTFPADIRRVSGVRLLIHWMIYGSWHERVHDKGEFLDRLLEFLRFLHALDGQNGREPVLFVFDEVFAAVNALSLPVPVDGLVDDDRALVYHGIAAMADFLTDLEVHVPRGQRRGHVLDPGILAAGIPGPAAIKPGHEGATGLMHHPLRLLWFALESLALDSSFGSFRDTEFDYQEDTEPDVSMPRFNRNLNALQQGGVTISPEMIVFLFPVLTKRDFLAAAGVCTNAYGSPGAVPRLVELWQECCARVRGQVQEDALRLVHQRSLANLFAAVYTGVCGRMESAESVNVGSLSGVLMGESHAQCHLQAQVRMAALGSTADAAWLEDEDVHECVAMYDALSSSGGHDEAALRVRLQGVQKRVWLENMASVKTLLVGDFQDSLEQAVLWHAYTSQTLLDCLIALRCRDQVDPTDLPLQLAGLKEALRMPVGVLQGMVLGVLFYHKGVHGMPRRVKWDVNSNLEKLGAFWRERDELWKGSDAMRRHMAQTVYVHVFIALNLWQRQLVGHLEQSPAGREVQEQFDTMSSLIEACVQSASDEGMVQDGPCAALLQFVQAFDQGLDARMKRKRQDVYFGTVAMPAGAGAKRKAGEISTARVRG